MNITWETFIKHNGAEISAGRVAHYGHPDQEIQAALAQAVICDLNHFALISVSGEDAKSFLQSQLTNDIGLVTAQHSQLSAYLNPKGRALALFRIFIHNSVYQLLLPRPLLDPTLQRLRKYVLRAKVTLASAEAETCLMGCSCPQGDAGLQSIIARPLPEQVDAVTAVADLTVLRIPGPHPRYILAGPCLRMQQLWAQLSALATPIGAGAWDLLDIRAGMPNVWPETIEEFIPQMLNLPALGAVSFTKGCYPGQEIVARSHYLGKVKRRMYALHCATETPPAPGALLYNPALGSERVGIIVTAQRSPQGGCEALAVLDMAAAETTPLHLHDAAGPPCKLLSLPYNVPT